MFIHHHRVQEFLDHIIDQESFTGIKTVATTLIVKESFLDPQVRKSNPNWQTQGCVATLARYCVMFGVLIFYRIGCKPTSVQVTTVKKDEHGMPTEVICKVHFENVRMLPRG